MKKIILFILFVLFSTNAFSIIYPITPKYVSLKKNIVNLRWNASLDAPIHFIYQKKGLPVSLMLSRRIISLPLYEGLSELKVKYICSALNKVSK